MDQPGRCRRTDGKRWRCSKEVIPNDKYCEKHMHRGCGRSRKLVETCIEKPSTHPYNVLKVEQEQPCIDIVEDPKEPRANDDGVIKIAFKLASSAFTSGNMGMTEKQHKLGSKDNGCVYQRVKEDKMIAENKPITPGKEDKCSNGKVNNNNNNNSNKSDSMGLELSVLHQGNQKITPSIILGDDLEHMRCRRTDGKRWRCRKEVIAEDHKYCAKHMHRGAKKRLMGSQGGTDCNPFALVKRANKLVVGFDSNLKS